MVSTLRRTTKTTKVSVADSTNSGQSTEASVECVGMLGTRQSGTTRHPTSRSKASYSYYEAKVRHGDHSAGVHRRPSHRCDRRADCQPPGRLHIQTLPGAQLSAGPRPGVLRPEHSDYLEVLLTPGLLLLLLFLGQWRRYLASAIQRHGQVQPAGIPTCRLGV